MDELEISGRRYISTKRAAKLHKYHADYIGQLVRSKKVAGQKVGRSWYVDAESLENYLNNEGSAVAPRAASMLKPIQTAEPVRVQKIEMPIIQPMPELAEEKVAIIEALEEKADDIQQEEIIETPEVVEPVIEPEVAQAVVGQEILEEKEVVEEKEETPIAIHVVKEEAVEEKSAPVRIQEKKEEKQYGGLRYVSDEAPLMPVLQKQTHALSVMPRNPAATMAASPYVTVASARRKTGAVVVRGTTLFVVGGITLIAAAALATFLISTTVVAGQSASVQYGFNTYPGSF